MIFQTQPRARRRIGMGAWMAKLPPPAVVPQPTAQPAAPAWLAKEQPPAAPPAPAWLAKEQPPATAPPTAPAPAAGSPGYCYIDQSTGGRVCYGPTAGAQSAPTPAYYFTPLYYEPQRPASAPTPTHGGAQTAGVTDWFKDSSVISGVPNWALLAGAALAAYTFHRRGR